MNLLLNPSRHSIEVGHVVDFTGDLIGSVFCDQCIEAVLATTDGDDEDAVLYHALGEA